MIRRQDELLLWHEGCNRKRNTSQQFLQQVLGRHFSLRPRIHENTSVYLQNYFKLDHVNKKYKHLFSFYRTRTTKKTSPTILRCRGDVFTEPLPSNNRGIYRQTHRPSFDTTRATWEQTRPTILLLCVFVCHGKVFTEPLHSNDTHIDIQIDGRDLYSTSLRRAQVS
jgi:hypothetical protein